jgi:hypothetical protein
MHAQSGLWLLVGAILCSTASGASAEEPLKLAGSQLEPVNWTDLAGWPADDHLAAFAAYQASCQALRKIRHTDDHRPIYRITPETAMALDKHKRRLALDKAGVFCGCPLVEAGDDQNHPTKNIRRTLHCRGEQGYSSAHCSYVAASANAS